MTDFTITATGPDAIPLPGIVSLTGGLYFFIDLPEGSYSVSASGGGLSATLTRETEILPNQLTTLDFDDAVPDLDPFLVYVTLTSGPASGSGTQQDPFTTLGQAITAVTETGVIQILGGTSNETFTGANAISKPMMIQSSDPNVSIGTQ